MEWQCKNQLDNFPVSRLWMAPALQPYSVGLAMKKASETCDAVPDPVAIEGFPELGATGVALERMALEQWPASDEIVCAIQDLMLLLIAKGRDFQARSIAVRSSPGLSEIGRRLPAALVDLAASFRQSARLLDGLKQCVVRADEALVPFTLAFPSQASGVLGQDCVNLGKSKTRSVATVRAASRRVSRTRRDYVLVVRGPVMPT